MVELYFTTWPAEQVSCQIYLPDIVFYLPRASGQALYLKASFGNQTVHLKLKLANLYTEKVDCKWQTLTVVRPTVLKKGL